MAGVPIDKFNEGFTQLAAAAGAEGINLRGSIEDMAAMVQAGANPTEIAAAADALAGQFKNIQVDDGILARAAAGQEGAIALLTARMEVFASNADSQAESSTLVNDNLEKLNSSLARGEAVLSGIANQLTVTSQKIKDNLLDGYLKAFDINPNDPNKFANFINQLERLPDSEKFQTFMNGLIEFTTALSGAQGVLSLLDVDGSGKLERGLNIGLLVAAIAKQLGVTGVAAGAIPGLRKGGATGPDQARRQMDPSTLNGIGLNALFATGGALAATVAMKTTDGKEIGPENPMPVTIMKVENGAFSQVTIKTSTTSSN